MLRQYYSNQAPESLLERPGVLAAVLFEPRCDAPSQPGLIPIGIESLDTSSVEVIEYGDSMANRGIQDDCHWSQIDDVMCVSTWIPEAECSDIESATHRAYLRLFKLLNDSGYAHPFRIWNFIPNINSGDGDSEEYKKFCVGRQSAFDELSVESLRFPAASALGHHSKGAVIYVLASNRAGVHHENPRQERAYQYPRQYGPSSPSFARATSIELKQKKMIFISGTASILGHETQSPGDLRQQLEITLENIQFLLSAIESNAEPLRAIRVYLRHADDAEVAKAFLGSYFPFESMIFVLADICRANLLVEIEAASLSAVSS